MNLYGLIKDLHIVAVTAFITWVVGRALIRPRLLRLETSTSWANSSGWKGTMNTSCCQSS